MKKGLAVRVLIMLVLAIIVLFISGSFIARGQEIQKTTLNVSIFRMFCPNLTFKYGCNLNMMSSEEREKFLSLCAYEFGKENVEPEKCKKECGCSGAIISAINIFKKYTGIECGDWYCTATQAGLYALMVKLVDSGDISPGDSVFYIDGANNYHTCFKIKNPGEGFFIKFKGEDRVYNCGSQIGCFLESSSSEEPGRKNIYYVSDAADNKIYLNDIPGYQWVCNGCIVRGTSIFESDNPLQITFESVSMEWLSGPIRKFIFKVKPCGYTEPIPDVQIFVSAVRDSGTPLELEIPISSYVGSGEKALIPAQNNFNLKIEAVYNDYYTSDTPDVGDVYIDIRLPKDKFDVGNIITSGPATVMEYEYQDPDDSNYIHKVFQCELGTNEKCTVLIPGTVLIPDIMNFDNEADIEIRYWAYSTFEDDSCTSNFKKYTSPPSMKCKDECSPNNDFKDIIKNCDPYEYSFTLKKVSI